ncbi:MAG: sensor histidine kinase, partial [Burkholderiales bacterium]
QAHVDIQTGLHVSGDSRLIGVVLENLIGNAIKFSRNQPQPQIWLSADASGDEVVFQLRDNGAGFDMQWQGKLFKVFQRLHKETEFEGTGIGLATVQRVIARHGGRIWVQAAPGQGASFFFTLPDGGQ